MNKKTKVILYSLLFFGAVIIDRVTKVWALLNLQGREVSVFKGFNLTLAFNRGVSWGILSFDSPIKFYLLALFILIIICVFLMYIFRVFTQGKNVFFEVLVLAGAFSNNVIDRFIYQGVVDFIDLYFANWHWPIFNIADIFVVVGVFGIIGRYFFNEYFSKN